MALTGSAFITMWHDLDPAEHDEWHAWHTHEHMAERVGIPGFLAGRRYWNDALPRHRCFTMYEAEDAEIFRSPAYLERLNNPTPWTTKVQPAVRNFLRIACQTEVTTGPGIGGSVLTWRLTLNTALDADAVIKTLRTYRPILSITIAKARPDITAYRTTESDLRPGTQETGFDALVMAETIAHDAAAQIAPEITQTLHARPEITGLQQDLYDLSFRLAKTDLT